MENLNQSISPYYIYVGNLGAYVAYCNVRYISKGKIVIFNTPSFSTFEKSEISIPEDAYNITVDVYIATFIGVWYKSCEFYSQGQPFEYYELYGTIFNPYCRQIYQEEILNAGYHNSIQVGEHNSEVVYSNLNNKCKKICRYKCRKQ
ncbi:MAG: hypothetical protein RR838_04020 [Clostridium sp.]